MAKVKIKYPEHSVEDRRRILDKMREETDVDQGLESLIDKMNRFETQYGMSTIEFYARFVAGKMGDSRDFIIWAGLFRLYHHLLETHFSQAEVA
ncbi:MAG: hypothetical protein ACREXT_08285 [Gammaproteobacteria bacterium]